MMLVKHSLYISQSDLHLHLSEWGSGEPTIVFLHGIAEGGHVWDHLAPLFSTSWRILVIDLRGHGSSSWDRNHKYQLDHYISDVKVVIDEFCEKPFILVGHSLGAEIAINITAECPQMVKKLVIIDFGPDSDPEALAEVEALILGDFQTYRTPLQYAERLMNRRVLVNRKLLMEFAYNSLRLRPSGGGFELKCDPWVLRSADVQYDDALWIKLKSITCPALLLRGNGSAVLTSKMARQMVASMHNCHLETICPAGHGVMLDNPRSTEMALRKFFES